MDYDKEYRQITMIERFVDVRDRNVLEIGCGDGSMSILLARDAREYIAIDPDEPRIREAQLLASNVEFQIGTGEALEFTDASFHVVLFTLSLHHQNSQLALKEADRVLTENGQLVILEPAADGELQQFFHLFNDETQALTEALNAIEQSDFKQEHHETFCTVMTFHNYEELCRYPFDRTTRDPNDCARILEKLRQLHGSLTDIQPIHLHDKIHIFSLRKTHP
ncbi:MAG: class I SAM-dependent methyltransferase [Chloroflexota bacterium]